MCADLIRGNSSLQEKFGDIDVFWGPRPRNDHRPNGHPVENGVQRINVIEALLKLALESSPNHLLDARLAASECIKAFFANHAGIRMHVLGRAINGHLSGEDQIPNILSLLLTPPEVRGNADPYQTWIASVLMFHLVFEDPDAKTTAMKVTEGDAESGEEVITCVQNITGNLITGIQRGDDERISVGYLMLLCGWLFEDPDVVNDFLGEGSSIQSLLQEARHRGPANVLVAGLCTVLLGVIYEFSTKDSPIPRQTIHKLLIEQLGRDQYIDKITRFRESPLVRDFEVLPQTVGGQFDGLPGIFFDRTFVEFLKDNFSRLTRSVDREPGLEVSVVTNGVQRGVSRELVDSLRGELEDRKQAVQKLESDMLDLRRQLEQEQFNHKQAKDSSSSEYSKVQQMNEALQSDHQQQLTKLEEEHKHAKNELLRQHGEQLRAIDNQLKETSAEYERRGHKLREHHEGEVAELQKTIHSLESELGRKRQQHEAENAELKRAVESLESNADKARAQFASESAELRRTIQSLESNADKVKEQHAAKVADLNKTIQSLQTQIDSIKEQHATEVTNLKSRIAALQSELQKLKEESARDVQAVHEDYKAKCSALEKRAEAAESRPGNAGTDGGKTAEALEAARREAEKAKAEAKEKEEARKAAQSELDDLLIVFGDLEAKRNQDKVGSHLSHHRRMQLTAV